MNYASIILNPEIFDIAVKNSRAPNKDLVMALFKQAIEHILSEGDFSRDFIEQVISLELNNRNMFEKDLEHYISRLHHLVMESDGDLSKKQFIDILDEQYIPSLNCAVVAAIDCVDILNSEEANFTEILRVTKYINYLKPLEINLQSLLSSEERYNKRMKGLKSRHKLMAIKSPTVDLAMFLAKRIWEQEPSISINTVAIQVHNQIEDMLNDFRETGNRAYIKHGLFELKAKSQSQVSESEEPLPTQAHRYHGAVCPEDNNFICVPLPLEKPDTIRYHITPLKPDTSRTRITDKLRDKIDLIIERELV